MRLVSHSRRRPKRFRSDGGKGFHREDQLRPRGSCALPQQADWSLQRLPACSSNIIVPKAVLTCEVMYVLSVALS